MNIIFQNDNLMVLDKPHGWLTTPARAGDDPRPCLGRRLQELLTRQIYPVHRLDFEVSGLTVFALNADSHRIAQLWFEEGLVTKTYEAFTAASGGSPQEWQEWHSKLVRGKKRSFEAPHGKLSRTRARLTTVSADLCKWELQPLTGRPHQLRFEMAKHGFPILGDTLYGGKAVQTPGWIALRAVELDFTGCGERLGLPPVIRIEGLPQPFPD